MEALVSPQGEVIWCGSPAFDDLGDLLITGGTVQASYVVRCQMVPTEADVTGMLYQNGQFVSAIPSATVVQLYAAQLALGMALTCAGNQALNGIYTTPVPNGTPQNIAAQSNISAVEASIGAGRGLPGGGTTFNYFDSSGGIHAFDATHWNEAATAFMNYSYALQDWYLGGCIGAPPSNQITIA